MFIMSGYCQFLKKISVLCHKSKYTGHVAMILITIPSFRYKTIIFGTLPGLKLKQIQRLQ